MDDRIAEIREALPIAERTVGPVNDAIVTVIDAARAYADLLESDALIVRRDENGKAEQALMDWMPDTFGPWLAEGTVKTVLAALASSQGVEPQ